MNSKTTRHSHLSLWYTTAAAAAVGGGLACPANEAVANIISYSSGLTAGPSANLNDTTGGVWFNFGTVGDPSTGKSQTTAFSGAQFRLQWNTFLPAWTNLFQVTAGDTLGMSAGSFNRFYPLKLGSTDLIGPSPAAPNKWDGPGGPLGTGIASSSVMNLAGSNKGVWTAPSTGYLGLRFGTPGNFNYAWAEVSIAANKDPKLVAFSYETAPNTPILAGAMAVPEPNPLLLLATGAAGLGAYRAWRARRGQRRVPEPVTA